MAGNIHFPDCFNKFLIFVLQNKKIGMPGTILIPASLHPFKNRIRQSFPFPNVLSGTSVPLKPMRHKLCRSAHALPDLAAGVALGLVLVYKCGQAICTMPERPRIHNWNVNMAWIGTRSFSKYPLYQNRNSYKNNAWIKKPDVRLIVSAHHCKQIEVSNLAFHCNIQHIIQKRRHKRHG